jgi:hypothetical protein
MVASAADHALLSALFQLFLREILSTLSMLTHASTAVLAQLSVLFQLSHRADNLTDKAKSFQEIPESSFFIFLYPDWQI